MIVDFLCQRLDPVFSDVYAQVLARLQQTQAIQSRVANLLVNMLATSTEDDALISEQFNKTFQLFGEACGAFQQLPPSKPQVNASLRRIAVDKLSAGLREQFDIPPLIAAYLTHQMLHPLFDFDDAVFVDMFVGYLRQEQRPDNRRPYRVLTTVAATIGRIFCLFRFRPVPAAEKDVIAAQYAEFMEKHKLTLRSYLAEQTLFNQQVRLLVEGFKLDVVMETVPYQPRLVQFVNAALDRYLAENEAALLGGYAGLEPQETTRLVCALVVLAVVCQNNALVCRMGALDGLVADRRAPRAKLLDLEDRIDELYGGK